MPKERMPKPKQPGEKKPGLSRFQVTTQEELAGKKRPIEAAPPKTAEEEKVERRTIRKAEPKKEIPRKPESATQKKNPPAEKTLKKPEKETDEKKQAQLLEKARESYVRAKLELDKNPKNSAAKQNFENVQKTYLKEKQASFNSKLESIKEDLKGKPEKEKEKIFEKAASVHLATEFKKNYDLKTKFLAEQKEKEKPGILKMLQKMSDKYKNMSFKEKTAISLALVGAGSLVGAGVTAGVIGSGVGLALSATIAGARGILTGVGGFVGSEALVKRWQRNELEKLEKEPLESYRKLAKESLESAKVKTVKGLIKFLQSRDLTLKLEKKSSAIEKSMAEKEKTLANRRYLIATSVGILTGLGATYSTFEHLVRQNGLSWESVFGKAEAKAPLVPAGAAPESIVHAADQHANLTATVEKSGSISKSAWRLVNEGKLSKEEMLRAWKNSFVEIRGVKVPIKDVGLSHAGDQVAYVPGVGHAPGHFEVVDYAKDKLSLGTNEDLYKVYEKLGKSAPNWLREATGHGHEALKAQTIPGVVSEYHQTPEPLPFPEAEHLIVPEQVKDLEYRFNHGDLGEQEVILKQLDYKIVHGQLDQAAKNTFKNLWENLKNSALHNKSTESYEAFFKPTGLTVKEYDAIKNMKVGEFLAKRGRSWWSDYFFRPDSAPLASAAKDATPVSEILHQRKLAQLIRKMAISAWEKNLFIDDFIKMSIKG